MIKKSVVIFVAIIALMSFGTVSSAQAFIDPASLSIILGATMISIVVESEHVQHVKEEHAKSQEQQKKDTEQTKKADHVSCLTPSQ